MNLRFPALCLVVASCSNQPSSSASDQNAELRDRDAKLNRAIDSRNVDSIMVYYADDAMLMPTAEPAINGKAAIRAEWEHILAIPNFETKATLKDARVASGGDMAYTTGSYVATMMGEEGKQVSEPGKWVTIWKKDANGMWVIALDTYNTDVKPPDHK